MRHLRRTGIVAEKAQAAIFLSENHKYERKMACPKWSKKKVNFNQIIFTDEKPSIWMGRTIESLMCVKERELSEIRGHVVVALL